MPKVNSFFIFKQPWYLCKKGKYRGIKKVNTQVFTFRGINLFTKQGYYRFWFEFSQNFALFCRFWSRENVKTFK